MDNNRIIIILLCVIIAILVVGVVVFSQSSKEDSNLAIADKKISAGDSLAVKLTDSNGKAITNQTVNVKLTDNDGTVIDEDITTDSNGNAKFKMKDEGKYSVKCGFDGNGQYASSSTAGNVTVEKAATKEVSDKSSSKHTISVKPEFDKHVKKTSGEYTVEVTKWRGTTVGGFGVLLYKNGELMDRYSYQSRAYFKMDEEWKWSNWDSGEEGAMYHKYPVSNDVDIKEIEVRY